MEFRLEFQPEAERALLELEQTDSKKYKKILQPRSATKPTGARTSAIGLMMDESANFVGLDVTKFHSQRDSLLPT